MADKKPQKPTFTSPKGRFKYPYLVKPDFGNEEFPKPNGEYKVQLILEESDPETQKLIAKLQPLHDAAVEAGEEAFKKLKVEQRKKLKDLSVTELYSTEYDKETEEPTGNIVFKFSTSASGKNAKGEDWSRKIPLFDARGKKIDLKQVGGGTLGKISFEVSSYFIPGTGTAGLKFYLLAAQVLELKEFGDANAERFGFGEEDGYDGIEQGDTGGFSDETGGESTGDAGTSAPDEF